MKGWVDGQGEILAHFPFRQDTNVSRVGWVDALRSLLLVVHRCNAVLEVKEIDAIDERITVLVVVTNQAYLTGIAKVLIDAEIKLFLVNLTGRSDTRVMRLENVVSSDESRDPCLRSLRPDRACFERAVVALHVVTAIADLASYAKLFRRAFGNVVNGAASRCRCGAVHIGGAKVYCHLLD